MSESGSAAEALPSHAPPKVQLQDEHRWLHKLVGEWTYEVDEPPAPGQKPSRVTGTEIVRSIEEVWVLGEGRGEMPGGETTGRSPLGCWPPTGRGSR